MSNEPGGNAILIDAVGSAPELSKNLEVTNRTINSIDQAYSVCETMINDWKKGILNAARITAKLNGERPYNQKRLKDALKDWKTNISTGFLATECRKVLPRLHMPLKTAKYLTASALPQNWPNGVEKTEFYRQTITDTIRSWPKFNFYIRGLAREVGVYGFAFNVWFDEWDWRPNLMRMDKGFVPQGTEVMDTEPPFFLAKYDYAPWELLDLLRKGVDAGRTEWKKEAVVKAINWAAPRPVDATFPEARSYEDLVRQATWGYRYTKGYKSIQTWHLYAKEATGKVSHYILLASSNAAIGVNTTPKFAGDPEGEFRVLYENLDQFDSMSDAVNTMVFDFGDGTVHGSWGAGQILYDLAAQVEKIRCDSIDNMRLNNKVKAQVPEGKNVNDVKLTINDQMVIVSGAQFAGNTAAMPTDVQNYEQLDQKLTQLAQQKIGAFVPPIPSQYSDIKAAQINAQLAKERELQEDVLENWLIQCAVWVRTISRRLVKEGAIDPVAVACQQRLLEKLTREEIDILANQVALQSVLDFTEFRSQQRAMFAASVKGDPLFRQAVVARTMASGVGDERFVAEITVPEGDQSDVLRAQRDQLTENAAIALGQAVPVVSSDNDWVHMQTMEPGINQAVQSGNIQIAELGIQHYAGHYSAGVNKKTIPKEEINAKKSLIAAWEDAIGALKQRQMVQQQAQQAQAAVEQQARELVASGQV